MFGVDIQRIISDQITPQLAPLVAEGRTSVDQILSRLRALEEEAALQRRMVEYEYGRPTSQRGHDPDTLPAIYQLTGGQQIDLRPLLGKTVTRGFVENIGSATAKIIFGKQDVERTATKILRPGTAFDTGTFFYDSLLVQEAGEGAVSVEVVAQ